MINFEKEIESVDDEVAHNIIPGQHIMHAPQPPLPAVDSDSITFSPGTGDHIDGTAQAILENMRNRINALEQTLKNLGLLSK